MTRLYYNHYSSQISAAEVCDVLEQEAFDPDATVLGGDSALALHGIRNARSITTYVPAQQFIELAEAMELPSSQPLSPLAHPNLEIAALSTIYGASSTDLPLEIRTPAYQGFYDSERMDLLLERSTRIGKWLCLGTFELAREIAHDIPHSPIPFVGRRIAKKDIARLGIHPGTRWI